MCFLFLFVPGNTCLLWRCNHKFTEMYHPDPESNGGAQNPLGPPNTQLTPLSVQRKPRKQKKAKDPHVECQNRSKKLENSRKRKAHSNDTSESRHGASLDSTQPVNKRARVTVLPAVGSTASSLTDNWDADSGFSSEASPPTSGRSSPCVGIHPSMLVAIDCEMVGTGPNGRCSELARCSILDYYGNVLYDNYILPQQPVTNFRTQWSGITREHLKQALPFNEARKEILQILKGKVIIGHDLQNDFKVLNIAVPRHMVRDTSRIYLLRQICGVFRKLVSLKKLASKLLNRSIQVGSDGHCSVEDALAALDLYKLVEDQWEKSLQDHINNSNSIPEPTFSLDHYMQDQYWPQSMMDCNE